MKTTNEGAARTEPQETETEISTPTLRTITIPEWAAELDRLPKVEGAAFLYRNRVSIRKWQNEKFRAKQLTDQREAW